LGWLRAFKSPYINACQVKLQLLEKALRYCSGTRKKLGTTNNFIVAATKNFAAATKRFVDRTKHFVVVTKYFCYPYFN